MRLQKLDCRAWACQRNYRPFTLAYTMAGNMQEQGDQALADAFEALLNVVLQLTEPNTLRSKAKHAPHFSYLLRPKQFDKIRKICREMRWPVPNRRGVLIDVEAIAHPLQSRGRKDGCSPSETLSILVNAYSAHSQIGFNKPKHAQGIIFNTGRKVRIGNAMYFAVAVLSVCENGNEKYLAPVTAYHATETKLRNIK